MKTKRTVLLFEDSTEERPVIADALQRAMPKDVTVIPFEGGKTGNEGTYENRIRKHFKALGGADFIICDQDLSQIPGYSGLSAQVIMGLAYAEGIPVALYSRGKEDFMTQRLKARRPFLERRFLLHLDDQNWDAEQFARKARIIFDGCQSVLGFLQKKLKKTSKPAGQTPAKWMSQLLDRPQIVNRLELYGSGDQQYLSWLVASGREDDHKQFTRVLAAELSYWLWDSILRFPGITVNKVAAASLLNLSPETWEKPEVQALFESAKYHGPFAVDKKFWWRDELQAIVRKAAAEDGLAFVTAKGIKGAVRSSCRVKSEKTAGYYCMLSEEPVSREESVGNIPYFPSGADLARISRPEFKKVAPWAGLQFS
jgi:hypothetical protein